MTEKRIVWQNSGGSISITVPMENVRAKGESEQEWLERIAASAKEAIPSLTGAQRLPDCLAPELPDRRFRDCWRNGGSGGVAVDMPLARVQRLNEIRAERDRRLEKSDGLMARANETGSTAEIAAVKTSRQYLRDLPASFALEGIATPGDLALFEPDWPSNIG